MGLRPLALVAAFSAGLISMSLATAPGIAPSLAAATVASPAAQLAAADRPVSSDSRAVL